MYTNNELKIWQGLYNKYLEVLDQKNEAAVQYLIENYKDWDDSDVEFVKEWDVKMITPWMEIDYYVLDFLSESDEHNIFAVSNDTHPWTCALTDLSCKISTVVWYWYTFPDFLAENMK